MAVFLTALKITGILLFVVLGLLLAALLLLLFVPFRYDLSGSYVRERPDGTVYVSWLFRAVSLRLTFHEGRAVSGRLCIFGVPVRKIEGQREEGGAA